MADDELTEALRARGLRMTPQRQRVLDAVRTLGHATPDEISASLSDVDVATVYRAVQLLEALGLVAHTHLGHGAPSYRPADDEHIHVVCHDCGRVLDAPPGLASTLVRRLDDERGFTVDLAHFTVFGRCADCAAGAPADGPARAHHHDHPAHDHPDHDLLAHDHAAHDHPTRDHPARDHPAHDHPAHDHPAHDHPAHDHPAHDRAAHDQANQRAEQDGDAATIEPGHPIDAVAGTNQPAAAMTQT